MSPAQRGTLSQQDWSEGMNRSVAPSLISPAGAYDLVNVLLDEDGQPYRRGGTAYKSQSLPNAAPVLDDFNRANESPVSQGGNWDGALESTGVDLRVFGEKLITVGLLTGSAVYKKTVTDGSAYVTFTELGALANGLAIRTAGEGDVKTLRGYFLAAAEEASGHWSLSLLRSDPGGTSHQIAVKTAQRLKDGDSLAIMAIGTSISGWRKPKEGDWTRILIGEDSTYASGRIGLYTVTGRMDDFGGGTITPFSTTGLTWVWDGYLQPGARTVFADGANFGVLDKDDVMVNLGGAGLSAPRQSAVLEDLLFIGGSAIYGGSRKTTAYTAKTVKVVNGSKTVAGTETAFEANVDAGMLFQIGTGRVYVVASVDSNTQITLRDKYEGSSEEKKAYSLTPLYSVGSDPYETWEYMTTCANRLVVGFGNTIKYTEVKNPHTFTNSLETTNEHTLPEGVNLVGLATVGQTVLAFTTAGVWTLDGLAKDVVDQYGNDQHTLQRLSSGIALAGAAGLAGAEQQLVVPAADGIYLMDGVSQPVRISRPVDNLYRARIVDGYKLGRAVVYRGHYLLPIISTTGSVKDLLVCRLDRPTRSRKQLSFPWTRFTGDGGEIAAYAVRSAASPGESALFGAQSRDPSQVEDCSAYFEPDDEHEVDADGTCHDLDVISGDDQSGEGTINRIRALLARYELKGANAPKLRAYYSDGAPKGGALKYGTGVKYGSGAVYGGGGATFIPIGEAGESNGHDRARFRVNKGLRYIRTRIKSSGPASVCALREVELTTRPSGAPRR